MLKYYANCTDGIMNLSVRNNAGELYSFQFLEQRGTSLMTFIERALDLYDRIERGVTPFHQNGDVICKMHITKHTKRNTPNNPYNAA